MYVVSLSIMISIEKSVYMYGSLYLAVFRRGPMSYVERGTRG